jgi:cytochrome c peroxidase
MFRFSNVRRGFQGVTVRSFSSSHGRFATKSNFTGRLALFTGLVVGVHLITNKSSDAAGLFGSSAPVVDYGKLKKEIAAAIEADDKKRGDGTSMGPTLVRLAWHASGTYSVFDKTGGSSSASMRFPPESNWGANAGLKIARDFLEPFKKKYPSLSYGDLWTLSGAVAIENMAGPSISWRPGRKDLDQKDIQTLPDGRLPGANLGCPAATNSHIRDIFGRMGFNDREIVALLGAHAVGRCHTDASGFWGPWTNAETTFSNEYFRLLLEEKWTVKKTHEGKPWTGPMQYEAQNGELMMLPSDLWLLQDPEFKKYVDLYAKDETAFFNDFSGAFSKLLELGVKF